MIKKIICIIPLLLLTLLFTFANNSHAQSISNDNLASPDLPGKEYLGGGEYTLVNSPITSIKYNVYNGKYIVNNSGSGQGARILFLTQELTAGTYTISIQNINIDITYKGFIQVLINGVYTDIMALPIGAINDYTFNLENNSTINFYLLSIGNVISNGIFNLQIEKGSTATPYKVPLQPIKYHENTIFQNGYDLGYIEGYNEGYIEGFNDGLLEAFNLSNYLGYGNRENITNKTLGQAGPGSSWFGFEIRNIGIKINTINFFNLDKFSLFKSIDFSELGWHAGITLNYVVGGSSRIEFRNGYTEYEQDMTYYHNDDRSVDNILISFSHNGTTGFDWNEYFNTLRTEIGVYFNNEIYKGSYLEKIRELEFNKGVEIGLNSENNESYGIGYNVGYDNGLNIGYNKGVSENQANGGFGLLLTQVFVGIGSILSIELLPNMPIGAFIAVPIVFGIIFFIIGRKKE